MVLNRRGMENFEANLVDGEDVELTDDYVILKVDDQQQPGGSGEDNKKKKPNNTANNSNGAIKMADGRESVIYGLWIFSEPPPSSTAEIRAINAQFIKEYAVHGGQSKKLAAERSQAAMAQYQQNEGVSGSVPMGRQISLKELFGQQRAQDDEWSVKVHSPALREENPGDYLTQHNAPAANYPLQPSPWQGVMPPASAPAPAPAPGTGNDVLGDLFRRAGLAPQQ